MFSRPDPLLQITTVIDELGKASSKVMTVFCLFLSLPMTFTVSFSLSLCHLCVCVCNSSGSAAACTYNQCCKAPGQQTSSLPPERWGTEWVRWLFLSLPHPYASDLIYLDVNTTDLSLSCFSISIKCKHIHFCC